MLSQRTWRADRAAEQSRQATRDHGRETCAIAPAESSARSLRNGPPSATLSLHGCVGELRAQRSQTKNGGTDRHTRYGWSLSVRAFASRFLTGAARERRCFYSRTWEIRRM